MIQRGTQNKDQVTTSTAPLFRKQSENIGDSSN
jgi:hypothetical protein